MKNHNELSDLEFEKEFFECTMSEDVFSHEAHIRLAWIYIHKYGSKKAVEKVNDDLKRYTRALGAESIYNVTVTTAGVKIVDHLLKKTSGTSFDAFVKEFPDLLFDFKGLITKHYSIDVFKSMRAKGSYLEPDLDGFG